MPTPHELEEKFWKDLKSDRTMMLGLEGIEGSHTRPMTAQRDGETGPIWFFTSIENTMVQKLGGGTARANATFTSKGHEIFACVHGTLQVDTDRAVIDRLWNSFIAAWYEDKNDPKIALLRFDAEHAEIWENASSIMAGIKMMLGVDPKKDNKDKVADVQLHATSSYASHRTH